VYGSEVLHLWTASQEPENDAVFSESKLEEMKRYYSRLRLSLRFLTSNLYDYDSSLHNQLLEKYKEHEQFDMHRFMLKTVSAVYEQCTEYFEHYQFKKALDLVYNFCDKTLSNFYFEAVKNTLYLRNVSSEERLMTQVGLYELMNSLFDLVKVFCPFVAEEFYQDYYAKNSVFESMHLFNHYQQYQQYHVLYDWEKLSGYRKEVQASLDPYQKDKTLKSRTEASVNLSMPDNDFVMFKQLEKNYQLGELLGVGEVHLTLGDVDYQVTDLKQNSLYAKCPRCWNYSAFSTFVNHVCQCCEKDQ
jgi:isoleucyl-tRNA synthetase